MNNMCYEDMHISGQNTWL